MHSEGLTKLVNAAELQTVKHLSTTLSKVLGRKKKPRQTTILETDNPYLQQRAKNIKRISAKMDELNEENRKKDDNESLANVIRNKAHATVKRKRSITIRLTSKKKVIDESKCMYDHKDYIGGYEQETDKRYYNVGNDLHGTHCDECMLLFSAKEEIDMITPSIKDPIFVCLGRHKHDCKHSLCTKCHLKKLDSGGGRPRRRLKK